MMRYSNIHTHSDFSDGHYSAEEMLRTAIEKNFVSYGLSDHSDTPCDQSYCMKNHQFPEYFRVTDDLKKKYADKIEFFVGLEKDYYTDSIPDGFDYLVGSVHYIVVNGDCYPIDHSLKQQEDYIRNVGKGDKNELAKRYFEIVAEHAIKSKFDVQGHFDVITKFGVFDERDEKYEKLALEALDVVLDNVPFIEVNTGGIFRKCRTSPYPEDFLLRHILEKGGKIVINGDSHDVKAVDFFFDESVALLKKIGFDSIWQLRKTGFEKVII